MEEGGGTSQIRQVESEAPVARREETRGLKEQGWTCERVKKRCVSESNAEGKERERTNRSVMTLQPDNRPILTPNPLHAP